MTPLTPVSSPGQVPAPVRQSNRIASLKAKEQGYLPLEGSLVIHGRCLRSVKRFDCPPERKKLKLEPHESDEGPSVRRKVEIDSDYDPDLDSLSSDTEQDELYEPPSPARCKKGKRIRSGKRSSLVKQPDCPQERKKLKLEAHGAGVGSRVQRKVDYDSDYEPNLDNPPSDPEQDEPYDRPPPGRSKKKQPSVVTKKPSLPPFNREELQQRMPQVKAIKSELRKQPLPQGFDQSTGDELLAIQAASRRCDLTDYYDLNHYHTFRTRREIKDFEILQQVQNLLAPGSEDSERKKRLDVITMAKAARKVGFVRCDGWCYNWLAIWLTRSSRCQQALMVELADENVRARLRDNHYFLLVPRPDQPWISKGDIAPGTSLKAFLKNNRVWLVDPSLGVVIAFDHRLVKRYISLIECFFKVAMTAKVKFSVIESYQKAQAESEHEDIDELQQRACQLLPLAYARYRDFDGKNLDSKGLTSIWLNETGTEPADARPDIFRTDIPWGQAALYCLYELSSFDDLPLPEGRPCNKDIAHCYRPDSDRYFQALRAEMIAMLQHGMTPESCLVQLQKKGVAGDKDWHPAPALIPERIYREKSDLLRNQSDWQTLGVQAFQLMAINPDEYKPSFARLLVLAHQENPKDLRNSAFLNNLRIRFRIIDGNSDTVLRWKLMVDRPGVKPAVQGLRQPGFALLKHCIHEDRDQLDEEYQPLVKQWTPDCTLRVCDPQSEPYQRAMAKFFTDGLVKNTPDSKLAEILASDPKEVVEPARLRALTIELPDVLLSRGYKGWNEDAIEVLRSYYIEQKLMNKPDIDEKWQRLSELMRICEKKLASRNQLGHLQDYLFRVDGFALLVADCFPEFDPELINVHRESCVRYLMDHFGVDLSRAPTTKKCLFAKQYFEEVRLLKPGTDTWKQKLHGLVHKELAEGHNLTYIALRRLAAGKIEKKQFSITVPGTDGCIWTHKMLWDLLMGQNDTPESLAETYEDNAGFMMETAYFQDKEEVPEYEGMLISYMTDPKSESTVESRLSLFRLFARKKGLTNEEGMQPKPYYAKLKEKYGTGK